TGRHEDSFPRLLPCKCSREFVDFRPTDNAVPTLCLKIYRFKTEAVLFDDSIDSTVARSPNCLSHAISHLDDEINNKLLKERWRAILDAFQQVSGKLLPDLPVQVLDVLFVRHRLWRRLFENVRSAVFSRIQFI